MAIRPRTIFGAGAILLGAAAAALILSRPAHSEAQPPWLKGYARTISGETMGYHSLYPDANTALIVRATDGRMAMEWETEPVPSGFRAPTATFVWMCGLATGKGAHRFDFSIDGKSAFSFRSSRDASVKRWEIPGPGGSSLAFRATLVDQFQELFGFMFLKMPLSALQPGRPLRLKVAAEKGGSPDWHMVFQYDLRSSVDAAGEPALIKRNGRLLQLVRVAVSHIAPPAAALISADGAPPVKVSLETGFNAVHIPVDALQKPREIEVEVATAGQPPVRRKIPLRPVVHRVLYLLPHSHNDIGYSDPQVKIEKDQWGYLEKAVELARKTAAYPEGARFKWNTEILWAVETYLRQASPEKREAFIAAARDGSIGLQALLANELTGICPPDELFEATGYARRLSKEYGLTINSAMITDIPSYSWSLVPALAQSGVRYLSSGPNYIPSLRDGGDRIGEALKAWGDKPFYWVSPSGREKILFWMAGRGYSWFHGLNLGRLRDDNKEPIFDYCRELEDKAYPYAIVQVRYTIGGDNGPPDPDLPDIVRRWNEEIETPRLVLATSQELFEEFELRYGKALPEVRGDFTPYWEDGAASSAKETAMNRAAAARLLQAETAWAMLNPAGYPAADFDEAWRQALLWDEHTWGAADSVSDPDGINARTQWAYKRAFAVEADRRSRELLTAALESSRPATPDSFAVLNTCSWVRSGVVVLPAASSAAGDLVFDDAGKPVLSQRLRSGELAFRAVDIPPFGGRRFHLQKGAARGSGPVRAEGNRIGNGRIRAEIDPRTGAVASLLWKSAEGVEFVDRTQVPGLNAYFYVAGLDPLSAAGVRDAAVTVVENGPLVASLRVESAAPGCDSLVREYRVAADSDRLEILDLLNKKKVRDKESVHIAFPFRVPGAKLRLDLGWAWIRPEADQIAGSCKDFFGVHNSADLSGEHYGWTWVALDAPLVEIGTITDETRREGGLRSWRTSLLPSQRLISYAMNNYWHTNYKADQEGPVTLRYILEPHAGEDLAAAKRIGLDAERPLLAAASAAALRGTDPILRIASGEAVITSLRPSRDGRGFVARLYNPSLRPSRTAVSARAGAAVLFSDPAETAGAALTAPLLLAPAEIVTLRIEAAGRR